MKYRKKILSMLVMMCMLIGILPTTALAGETTEDNRYEYEVWNSDTAGTWVSILAYTGNETEVVIPEEIDGYVVKEIGYGAFEANENIISVEIPDTVEVIGEAAFSGCNSLKSVVLPNAITSIPRYLFSGCSSLEKIEIPELATAIEECAFLECSSLKQILFSEGVLSIGQAAFSGCSLLENIEFPESVEVIMSGAFRDTDLCSASFLNDETVIAENAFQNYNPENEVYETNIEVIGKKSSTAERFAKLNYCVFKSLDGTYEVDYNEVVGCYDTALANYEAIIDFLNEYYIEKYPNLALAPISGSEKEHEMFKTIASEIIASDTSVAAPEALYNWMNENIHSGTEYGYPMDVYNFRTADCCGNANLLCQLLRSANIPAVVVYGFYGDTVNELDEREMDTEATVNHAWVLAYYEGMWQLLDSGMDEIHSDVNAICKKYYAIAMDDYMAVPSDSFNPVVQGTLPCYKDGDFFIYGDHTFSNLVGSWSLMILPEIVFKTWVDFDRDNATYLSDGSKVNMLFNQGGWISFESNGRVAYFKDNMSVLSNYVVEKDGIVYYFGQNGEPFNLTELGDNYRVKYGHPVVLLGTTLEIMPVVDFEYTEADVRWESGNTDVISVNEDGTLTAVGKGLTDVYCYIKNNEIDWEVSYLLTLYVDEFVEEVSVEESVELEVGETYVLEATTDKTSTQFANFFWESSDESVVSVDEDGNITALKPGTATITVTFADGSGLSDSCVVIVKEPAIEENFTYQFITEDGTVVDGTKVVISLCNEVEDSSKVIISESINGSGTFTVSHTNEYFIYEDAEYSMIEIYYSFPEGYVLADSENKTENTVWYSVENLCDGSNEITWFLEQAIIEEPEEDKEVDADKLGEETKDRIEHDKEKHVEVVAPDSNKIDKDVFESMDKHDKDITIGVKDKEHDRIEYSWTFSNKEMDDRDMEIDLNIRFDDEKKHEIKDHVGHDDVLCIRFAHHGKLPGPATIKNYVGDKYADGHKLYLYYFDEEQGKVLRIGDKPLEVKDGYIEYTITHCSTYFVMDDNLTNVEKDETSLADATLSVLDNDFDKTLATNATDSVVPNTGDNTPIGMYMRVLFLGVVLLLAVRKDKKVV